MTQQFTAQKQLYMIIVKKKATSELSKILAGFIPIAIDYHYTSTKLILPYSVPSVVLVARSTQATQYV